MLALLQRILLVGLVLLASPAPQLGLARRTDHASDTIDAGSHEPRVVAHHQLVGAPLVEARAIQATSRLHARPWVTVLPAPVLAPTVHHASTRARRAFTRPRVRRFRPAGPDDF